MPTTMTSDEIRESFLSFFESKNHLKVASSSLIPVGDPTLLLTIAGMNQFKPYFSGIQEPPNRRLTSSQKCFRTPDIDEVGDATHNTMFEMLGNFSIGDYFKEEVISYALEFLTTSMGLPKEDFAITVHHTDDEALNLWVQAGISQDRIFKFGDTDNWWGPPIHGDEGPCGPCSELHYDFGEKNGCLKTDCQPNCENIMESNEKCTRFVELWNLVFMQFYHHPSGERSPLPAPSIDTGMGLERLTIIMQNVKTMYETDIFKNLIQKIEKLSGVTYGQDLENDYAIRGIAEHSRSCTFLTTDGVIPSNEGRGYVLRRVIRRAIRLAKKIGIEGQFLKELSAEVTNKMGATYPELIQHKEFVQTVLQLEEDKFEQAFENGFNMLQGSLENISQLSGEIAFKLWDTYGFPIEMTEEIAIENNVSVDLVSFQVEMEKQRSRARSKSQFKDDNAKLRTYDSLGIGKTKFLGYETTTNKSVVVGLLSNDISVGKISQPDNSIEIILQETPFYSEGGGQVGDTGKIITPNCEIEITDTQQAIPGLTVHYGKILNGSLSVGENVSAEVDSQKRINTGRNHTATHMLHAALREVLGDHVRQAGSLVTPERLRFDFSHFQALTEEELWNVQHLVNQKVRHNAQIIKDEDTYSEAIRRGALAFFGDKYEENVRLIEISNGNTFSFEVCGGTHASQTGELGTVIILNESSIGSGMRRIEAVSGEAAEKMIWEKSITDSKISQILQTNPAQIEERVLSLLQQLEQSNHEKSKLESELSILSAQRLLNETYEINGFKLISSMTQASSQETLRSMGDWLKDKISSGAVCLGAVINDNPIVIVMATKDIIEKGVNSSDIAKKIASILGGGGGGRPDSAQAGGKNTNKLNDAILLVPQIIQEQLNAK
ncbi:MAG: alanine--tRNA ligase [Dehalococcoidia bacterium]